MTINNIFRYYRLACQVQGGCF